MTKNEDLNALEIARKHAKLKPQIYYAEPFQPHEWVLNAINEALQSTRKPPVHCSMAVDLTEWLYELFCESQSIDMNDVQTKMVDLGIIEGIKATTEDIDNGFDTNDIVFHKTEEYKKQSRTPPVNTIAVPREVLQGVRNALNDSLGHITYPSTCRNDVKGE